MKPLNRFLNLIGLMSLLFLGQCTKQEEPVPVSVPTLTTTAVSGIGKTTAFGGGTLLTDGNGEITQQGLVWNLTSNVTVNSPFKVLVPVGSTDIFSATMTGLTAGTTYFVRAFATNSAGTGYGQELIFTTGALDLATVTTGLATNIQFNAATIAGTVVSEGDGTVTDRGIVYKTSAGPTLTDLKQSSGIGAGAFTASLTGLSPGTTYFARAFATTSVGTSYGAELTFSTVPVQNLALRFDGVNDYVTIPQASLGTNITVEAWVYWEGATATTDATSNWQRVFDFNSGTGSYMFFSTRKNADFFPRFGIKAPGGAEQFLTGKYRWSTNRWHHVAVVLNGSTGRLYIDGVEEDAKSMTFTGSSLGSIANFWLGRSAFGDPYFKGRIDDVRIWNTARSASQVATNMKANLTGLETGLVSLYRFETTATANGTNTGITGLTNQVAAGTSGVLNGFSLTGSLSNWTDNVSFPAGFTIGQSYEGGKIAYLDATGLHGFIAAPSDQSFEVVWSSINISISTSLSITSGQQNTDNIVAVHLSGSYAASLCANLVLNNFEDWYLPSHAQAIQLASVASAVGLTSSQYWTSSQNNSTSAYCMYIPTVEMGICSKGAFNAVRAVRSF